ncbi:MAG: integration host factor subunit alpha [Desulfatiglandaceae bacterium]|jgi:integration host factor subunit alpha
MTLTKQILIDSVYRQVAIHKYQSTRLAESLLEIMKKSLESGEDVLISGFGKFCVKDKQERRGRNPQTGGDMILGARRVVVFKCSGVLRERINGKG